MSRFALLLLAACSTSSPFVGGKSCTEVACNEGVDVQARFADSGSYVITVNVDGVVTTCKVELPSGQPADACGTDSVVIDRLGQPGTINGIKIAKTNASSIAIHVTKDGTTMGDKTITPSYRVSPGPNGPDCDPKECRLATAAFP
jgi:hypothetical protein